MDKPRICSYDCTTNLLVDREMTDEEYAAYLEMQANTPALLETPEP